MTYQKPKTVGIPGITVEIDVVVSKAAPSECVSATMDHRKVKHFITRPLRRPNRSRYTDSR